jgi:putative salt-induced outer membrane protein YdiY
MKKFKWLILFLFIGNFGFSQTIINAERLIDGADSTIYAISASYNGTRGNSTTDQLDISPAFILLKKKNDYKLFGGYSVLSGSGKGILNSGFVHFRHNYKISGRIKTFEFYQLQFNDVLLLNKREIFGAGLRFSMIHKDSLDLDFELGLMKENEVLNKTKLLPDEDYLVKNYRITFVNSFKWIINKYVKLNNVIYYQPNVSNFRDYRILNDISLTTSLTGRIQLLTALTLRYDNKPPGTLQNLDSALSVGLNIKFNKNNDKIN